jgi:hypothetical protein
MNEQENILQRVRKDLVSCEDNLSPSELFRLQQARNQALSESKLTGLKRYSLWTRFSAVLASSVLVAVFVFEGDIYQSWSIDNNANLGIEIASYFAEDYDELDVNYWLIEDEETLDLLYGPFLD